MPKRRTFSRLLPLAVIAVFIVIIGLSMISVIRSEDRKDQQAWDEVLASDMKMSARAKKTMHLVDELASLQGQSTVESDETRNLKQEICDMWPSFYRQGADGGPGVPPVQAMRKQLKKYIRSG